MCNDAEITHGPAGYGRVGEPTEAALKAREIPPRYRRDAAEMPPRCRRDVAEIALQLKGAAVNIAAALMVTRATSPEKG